MECRKYIFLNKYLHRALKNVSTVHAYFIFLQNKSEKKNRIRKKTFQQRHFYTVLTTYIYPFVKLRAAPRMTA